MSTLQQRAERILQQLINVGFEQAKVDLSESSTDELGFKHNVPNAMSSKEAIQLTLEGVIDQRRASATLNTEEPHALDEAITQLWDTAKALPQNKAYEVSCDQVGNFDQGAAEPDKATMVASLKELLSTRETLAPQVNLEGHIIFENTHRCVLTNRASTLNTRAGHYGAMVQAVAHEGEQASSLNYAFGSCEALTQPFSQQFGIDQMIAATAKQVHTQRLDHKFEGSVLLSPLAALQLILWLIGQLEAEALLSGRSIYKDRVGERIASSLLSITRPARAPGVAPVSNDGFVVEDFLQVENGQLLTLTPSLYVANKTGLAHRPSTPAITVQAGDSSRESLMAGIEKGAVVGMLSMGNPAANGDFSGVIKNSFLIEQGEQRHALAETMISGNVADMLLALDGVSQEILDFGYYRAPWIRVPGLSFS